MFRRHSNEPRLSPHASQALAHIAAASEGLEQLWWLWRQHYLEAKRLEQYALTHPDEVPDTGGERPQHEVLLDAIPAGDLGPFERYHATAREVQLQQAAHPIDHDAVEAATIDWLIAEADGRHSLEDPPLGVVPTARGPIEVEIPRDLPGRQSAPRNTGVRAIARWRWAAIAAVPLVPLATTLYALSLFGIGPLAGVPTERSVAQAQPTATQPAPTATPLGLGLSAAITPTAQLQGVTGAATEVEAERTVEVIDPVSLDIAQPDGGHIVRPLQGQDGTRDAPWQPQIVDGGGVWLRGTYMPTVICLPPSDLALLTGLTRNQTLTLRATNGMARQYRVFTVRTVGRQQNEVMAQRWAGVALLQCGAAGASDAAGTRVVVEAVYKPAPLDALPAVAATGLADLARLEVQRTEIVTPTQALPPGTSEAVVAVAITNLQPAELRLEELADELEVGGQLTDPVMEARPPLNAGETRVVTFRYRVPSDGGAGVWRVKAGDAQTTIAVALPRPQPPMARLEPRLLPEQVQLHAGPLGQRELVVTLEVRNPAPEAIALDPAAIRVWDGATTLPLRGPLPARVEPGQTATVVLRTPAPQAKVATVTFGAAKQWQLELPSETTQ